MKHKLFCFVLILILILGSFAFVFAEDDFYYPMISYLPEYTYIAFNNSYNGNLVICSLDNPIYCFFYTDGNYLKPVFVSNYPDTSFNQRNASNYYLSSIYNSVYYYRSFSSNFSLPNDSFPIYSSINEGLAAFDNYFQEQGYTNDTVFNLGVFVAACLQFVAATASFIMQYPILMMFVLLPVISYIVILLRRLLLLGS